MFETVTMTFLQLYNLTHAGMVKGECSLFFSMHHPDTRSLFIATEKMSLRANQVDRYNCKKRSDLSLSFLATSYLWVLMSLSTHCVGHMRTGSFMAEEAIT